jgi:hypothetical protein
VSACQPRFREGRGLAGTHLESFKLRDCSFPSKKFCVAAVRMLPPKKFAARESECPINSASGSGRLRIFDFDWATVVLAAPIKKEPLP